MVGKVAGNESEVAARTPSGGVSKVTPTTLDFTLRGKQHHCEQGLVHNKTTLATVWLPNLKRKQEAERQKAMPVTRLRNKGG